MPRYHRLVVGRTNMQGAHQRRDKHKIVHAKDRMSEDVSCFARCHTTTAAIHHRSVRRSAGGSATGGAGAHPGPALVEAFYLGLAYSCCSQAIQQPAELS